MINLNHGREGFPLGRVAVIGELLIDFISDTQVSDLSRAKSFNRFFAGSPGNLVFNLRDLDVDSTILSRVGGDPFGRAYIDLLSKKGIDVSYIQLDRRRHTSFVIVSRSDSTPQFLALRDADFMLEPPLEIDRFLDGVQFLHLTSWPLSLSPARETTVSIVKKAAEKGIKISLDPNYRKVLWEYGHDGPAFIKEMLRYIYIVKPSDDDARHIFGEMQPKEYLDLFHGFGAKNVILTLGKRGSVVSNGFRVEEIAPCARRVVDTTGAGDAFWSGLYRGLLDGKDIFGAARYGNMCAAFRIEHEGKDTQLPAIEELKTIYERC